MVHCSHKGMDMVSNNTQVGCGVNDAQLVLRGPKCAKKTSPTPLHDQHQPEPLRQGRIDPCFHVLYAKFWPYYLNVAAEIKTHQTRQRFSNLLLSNFVLRLVSGFMCCVFRDGALHTLVVTSGYLSYCCLSIISNQSAHSPLTSTRLFRPHNCRSLDIFSFSHHFL